MLHRVVASAFKQVEESDYVTFDVGIRIFQGVAHPGLSGEVYNDFKMLVSKKSL